MKPRFLHLLQDSSYSKWIVEHFETVAPGQHDYIVFTPSGKVCNFQPQEKVQVIKYANQKIDLGQYKRIFVQYLDDIAAHFLLSNLPASDFSKVTWVLWGGDFYFIPGDERRIYKTFSWNYLYKNRWIAKKVYHFFRNYHRFLRNKPSLKHRLKAIKLIEVCASGIMEDVVYIEKRFHKKFCKVYEFRFLPLELMFNQEYQQAKTKGVKIIIGNSADPANNHYEILADLKQKQVQNTILCPLTYGTAAYKSLILQAGKQFFGQRFEALKTSMNKDEYYKKLQEVGFAVYNQNMQMGVGNLIGLLWLGVKVFLNKENPLYTEFVNWGLHVYTMEQLSIQELSENLSEEELQCNRRVLQVKYAKQYVLHLHKNLLEA